MINGFSTKFLFGTRSLATVAANGEPTLVGTTRTLLCPLIYHFFHFLIFNFFSTTWARRRGWIFLISWDVSSELLYAHIFWIPNTTSSLFIFFCVWSKSALNIYFLSLYLRTYWLYIYGFKVRYVDRYLTNMYEVSD